MSLEEILVSVLLMLSIVRQLRGRRLTWVSLLWPIALVVYACARYAPGIPSDRNDLAFVLALAALGLGIGAACGTLSRVWPEGDEVMTRATGLAAVLWVGGIGLRLVFAVAAEQGAAAWILRLGGSFGVQGFAAWSAGLILMSLLEVLGRTAVLAPRFVRARGRIASGHPAR